MATVLTSPQEMRERLERGNTKEVFDLVVDTLRGGNEPALQEALREAPHLRPVVVSAFEGLGPAHTNILRKFGG